MLPEKILVLDCYHHTLTVLRSLASGGYEPILGVTGSELALGFVHASRHVSATWSHPDIVDDPKGFENSLQDFLQRNPEIRLIYPVGENSVRALIRIRSRLPTGVLVVMPENEAVETCLDKPKSYSFAEKCQVPVPRYRTISSPDELRNAIDELGLPSIVKPTDSRSMLLDRKCVFVRTEPQLDTLVENWPDDESVFIAQRAIDGTRHNCDLVAVNGTIMDYCESEILRTDRPDYSGISVYDRSIAPDPLHKKYCEQLVSGLNYTGLALIQFLRDTDTGKSYFLEANPRTGATIALAVHCGVDLPVDAVKARKGILAETTQDYALNQTRCSLSGDLIGIRWALKHGEISPNQALSLCLTALNSCLRADCHATFAWNDRGPILKLYRGLLTRLLLKSGRA